MERTKHGQRGRHGMLKDGQRPPEYSIWKSLIQKCCNERCAQYKNYGGRNIGISPSWLGENGFANFLADVGRQPKPGAGLRRQDPNGNFEPGNVAWGDTRIKHEVTHNGKSKSIREWAEETGLNERTLRTRHRYKWPPKSMLTRPPAPRPHLDWYRSQKKRPRETSVAVKANDHGDGMM